MGSAILASVLKKSLAKAEDITMADISAERLLSLKEKYGVDTNTDAACAIKGKDIIFLAVKPQSLEGISSILGGKIEPGQLIISILAGVKTERIASSLKHKAIIRTMPNTPAQVGEGMTAWTATPEVTKEQKTQAKSILSAMGKEIFAPNEELLNAATAISGSGPAYVFLFMEALTEAAVEMGFNKEDAKTLALQTTLGASSYAKETGEEFSVLREAVTSPGGTTAAALKTFYEEGFTETMKKAARSALNRAIELGK